MKRERKIALWGACLSLGALSGCMTRYVEVTSEPPGALVTINDQEIGITPCRAEFTFYGEYDVLLEKDGYEPLRAKGDTDAPIYEYPPFDLPANAFRIDTPTKWHFTLSPALELTQPKPEFEKALIERASTLRGQLEKDAEKK